MGNAGDKILYTSESLADAARRLQQVGAALQRETGGLLSTLGQLDRGNGGDCRIQGRIRLTAVGTTYSAGTIEGFIREISKALNAEGNYAKHLAEQVKKVSEAFERTEKDLVGQVNGIFTGDDPFGGNGGGADEDAARDSFLERILKMAVGDAPVVFDGNILGLPWKLELLSDDAPIKLSGKIGEHEWSLKGHSDDAPIAFDGKIGDFEFRREVNGPGGHITDLGDIFEGEFDPLGGNVYLKINFDAEGHLGEYKGYNQVEMISYKYDKNISFITGALNGDIGLTLLKDGKLSPGIWAKLSGEASVLDAKEKNQFGNDQANVRFGDGGKVLTANGKAQFAFGMMERTTETGKTVNEFATDFNLGAEAYVATARVEAGTTIEGVDVDAGLEGKFIGGGSSEEFEAATSRVKADMDLGSGYGLGVDVTVDWADSPYYNMQPPSLPDINGVG